MRNLFLAMVLASLVAGIEAKSATPPPSSYLQKILRLRGVDMPEAGTASSLPPLSAHVLAKSSEKHSAASLDEMGWETPFFARGPAGQINALDFQGDTVIVGGNFLGADDVVSGSFALWDGARWANLGDIFPHGGEVLHPVYGVGFEGSHIYVAGLLDSLNGKPCSKAAYWDGQSWSCMGGDSLLSVSTLGIWNKQVFLGTENGIVRWNGTSWELFGSWQSGLFNRLQAHGNRLCVAGKFAMKNNPAIRNLAIWDGQSWSGLGAGPGAVRDLCWLGNEVFAIENYQLSKQVDSQAVVRWDGSTWSRVDSGLAAGIIMNVAADSQYAYLSLEERDFKHMQVCRWNGHAFQTIRRFSCFGITDVMKAGKGKVFLGGSLRGIDGEVFDNLSEWDGNKMKGLGKTSNAGPFSYPEIIRSDGKDLFLGGGVMRYAGDIAVGDVARWNGGVWDAMGGGFKEASPVIFKAVAKIKTFGFSNGDIYAGGRFDSSEAGGNKNIARWDGIRWRPLGGGMPFTVNDILINGNSVIAGGEPSSGPDSGYQGPLALSWDGAAWRPLGQDLNGSILKIISYKNQFFSCGKIILPDSSHVEGVVRLDSAKWKALTSPVDSIRIVMASDMIVFKDTLFILGSLDEKSGQDELMSWDGSKLRIIEDIWDAKALTADDQNLYIAGNFRGPQEIDGSGLVRRDAQGWHSLISAYHWEGITSLAIQGDYLYVSGRTGEVGGKPAYFLARWNRKTGMGSLPRTNKRNESHFVWKTLPCSRDCFPGVESAADIYDLQGRHQTAGMGKHKAAGVRAVKSRE